MSKRQLIIPSKIVTVNSKDEILTDYAVEIEGKVISKIVNVKEIDLLTYDGEIIRVDDKVLIPGFIQTHIHLCQTLFRGLADDLQLLDWLQQRIFPYENAHSEKSLLASVKLGINELINGGTTTLLDMGTLRHQHVIFDELISSGIRAFAGKCMMDVNDLFPSFKNHTNAELKETLALAKEYHNKAEGRIKYGFAPRFVLSCSEELLIETKEMMKDFAGSIYHTHSSENKSEVAEVRRRHNKENIEYFDHINILDDHTLLAHCIHLNENEIGLMKNRDTRISHCPSSNLKLASGIANIPRYLKEGINVSLGADGAPCNNNLSQFYEMRLAALIQKPIHGADSMDAKTVFKLATIEGAKALHIHNETGSIEIGKFADLVLLDLNDPSLPLSNRDEDFYSKIVYSANQKHISDVMINGDWKVRDGISLIYNQSELYFYAKEELNLLLKRTGV
ncbi:MAG: amidohydrolase family protein [Ignavibacteria bacterium]|nr:amidohydrolase family protein [Ignavibacteria bacterium]